MKCFPFDVIDVEICVTRHRLTSNLARLDINPGLAKPGLKTFEQCKFKPGLVNPSFKPGLGLNQDQFEQPGPDATKFIWRVS